MSGSFPDDPDEAEGKLSGNVSTTETRVDRQFLLHSNEAAAEPTASRAAVHRPAVRALGWLLLVAGLLGAATVLLAERFHYRNDDFLQFVTARDAGLSWELLSLNVFQHFGPYNRLGHWLVVEHSDLSPVLGLSLVLVNYGLLLAACLWLMTELGLSTGRRVAGLVLVALSVSVTESAIWFDAGMHILPAIAVTLAVCAAHVRAVRTRAGRWHVLAVVLFLLGQLVQERPVFALPLVVLVDVLLLWRHLPWRERLRRLRALRWPIAALAVAAAGIALALRLLVVVDSFGTPDWPTTLRTMLSALTNFATPALVNQPLADPAGLAVQLAVLTGLVLLGVGLSLMRRGNAGPVLFAAAVFLVYYGFLKLSPLLHEDTVTVNAARLNNAVYVTVPATIALLHLRPPARLSRPELHRRWRARPAAVRRVLSTAACLALAGYLFATNAGYLEVRWQDTTRARAYLDAVRAEADTWADQDVTLLPLVGPPAMADGWSRGFARHVNLLPLVRRGFVPGVVGGPPVLIDHRGRVRPAVVETLRADVRVLEGACGPSGEHPPDEPYLAVRRTRGEPLFLRLRYRADRDLELLVSAGRGREWLPNPALSPLPAGDRTALIPLEATRLELVDLNVVGAGELCVDDADIVRGLVVVDGECREVGWYGRPGAVVDCPASGLTSAVGSVRGSVNGR